MEISGHAGSVLSGNQQVLDDLAHAIIAVMANNGHSMLLLKSRRVGVFMHGWEIRAGTMR